MKKIISSIILVIFSTSSSYAATLTPSLQSQMQRQETVDKNLTIEAKKAANQKRLADLRARLRSQNQMKAQKTDTPITKTPTLPPKEKVSSAETIVTTKKEILPSAPRETSERIAWVDMEKVRSTWIGWYNTKRGEAGLSDFSFDARLDTTAQSWNQVFSAGRGSNHHERSSWDGYYNFAKISKWFADRGVVWVVKNKSTTVENVGYGYYSCSSSDCTDKLIESIRSTFEFYMREKSSNGPHYRSIMNSAFTKIGMSILVEPSEKRYYLVVHYITEFK